jgi:hypothetical protein
VGVGGLDRGRHQGEGGSRRQAKREPAEGCQPDTGGEAANDELAL